MVILEELSKQLRSNLPGIGYSDGTYSNVNFFSLSGEGSGATGSVTIADGVLSSVSLANTGTGYIVGESLGITTADVTKGTGAQISISEINGVDTLYLTNVKGEHLTVDDPLVYYDDSGIAQTLNTGVTTAVRTSIVSDELFSGNVIEVLHPNHALKDIRNKVDIYNVDQQDFHMKLNQDINATATSIGVVRYFNIRNIQGVSLLLDMYWLIMKSCIITVLVMELLNCNKRCRRNYGCITLFWR